MLWTLLPFDNLILGALLLPTIYFPSASALDPEDDPPGIPLDPEVIPSTLAAFILAGGTETVGGCDKYKYQISNYLQEAFDMAKSGLDITTSLLNREGKWSDAYLFRAIFGIDMVRFQEGYYMNSGAIYDLYTKVIQSMCSCAFPIFTPNSQD